MNRKNVIYVSDDDTQFACRNISGNSTKLGFLEDLKKLKAASPKPKGLKFRKVYAVATSTGGIRVRREYNIGSYEEEIYMQGGTIKQKVMIEGKLEELTFTVISAKGESRKFIVGADPGGPAPLPVVTVTADS